METIISGIASFFIFHLTTHPNSRLNKKLSKFTSNKRIGKRVEIFPRFNIEAKNRRIHIHHWMVFAPLFIAAETVGKGVIQSSLLNGFMLGGIIQGLFYKDSLKFIHHNKDYKKKITATTYRRIPVIKKIIN